MKFNKGPNTERRLDQIYVKYLLPYDTLSHQERQDIMRKVEIAWNRKNQKLLDRALNPLNRQKRLLGLSESSDDETEDEHTVAALNEAEDCITKGPVMNRAKFTHGCTGVVASTVCVPNLVIIKILMYVFLILIYIFIITIRCVTQRKYVFTFRRL